MPVPAVRIETESGPIIGTLPFTAGEYERRLTALRASMEARGLDFVVSFTPENIYYLTGHDTPGYYFYQACVVGRQVDPVNVLRRNESTNTLWRSWSRRVVVFDDRVSNPGEDVPDHPANATAALLSEVGVAGCTVGLETESWFVSPKRYAHLVSGIERAGGRIADASGIVERLRLFKSPEEIAYIRAAARIAEVGMAAAVKATQEGANENAVAAAAVGAMTEVGGEYAGLPAFITSGRRTVLTHSTWAGRTYEQGDVLNYELPGVVRRYAAAMFRTGTIGEPDPETRRRGDAIVQCLEANVASIRPGRTSHDVHMAGQDVLLQLGYDTLRCPGLRTGYSIGINYAPDWGEGHIMSIQEGDERQLERGMTFHLIPTFYDWGTNVIGTSDTVLVTDTGCEVITNYPRGLFVA